ncbi:hypothetical protein CLIB1444_01S05380 [[Candida] jaroonii]|uniref:Uncharacterized protein n=1 Tax=[Candida] jaroonii TaxID=467808 RepID=A0ACA9Y0D5_9ASCO|nr:hypothetical protein CLIB1444_01S05380 [[Candida] jaroonii]
MKSIRRFQSNSALTNRFNEILENKLSLDPRIKEIEAKVTEEKQFNNKYANQLGYLKSEKLLRHNQHGKEIANATPWTGTESTKDASLRMILDSKPKPKKTKNVGKRLVMAKEISNEYKDTKTIDKDSDDFKQLYQERFVGPNMLLNTANPNVTLNLVNTIASSKINSKINLQTGLFDDENMKNVRGKPLNKELLSNSTNSAYFVNEILNKQQVLPPWVETQQELNSDINLFRNSMKISLVKWVKKNEIIPKNRLTDIFIGLNKPYAIERIKQINEKVRDYNLQSPSSNFHKFKLNVDEELIQVVDQCYDQLPELVKDNEYQTVISNTQQGFLSLFDNSKVVAQRPVTPINFWSSFKQMFKEVKQT